MPNSFRIAIIEDHLALREIFSQQLSAQGYRVFAGSCAEDLDEYANKENLDLLILDLNLPGENGISIAKRYRNAYKNLQIIMLTVRADIQDKILGYESGADLYLPKPVSVEELNAAVKSVARRTLENKLSNHAILNPQKLQLSHTLGSINLSASECKILKALISSPNGLLEYWELKDLLGLDANDKGKTNLAVYMHRLNKKLPEIGLPETTIKSVWKVGYQLTEQFEISA